MYPYPKPRNATTVISSRLPQGGSDRNLRRPQSDALRRDQGALSLHRPHGDASLPRHGTHGFEGPLDEHFGPHPDGIEARHQGHHRNQVPDDDFRGDLVVLRSDGEGEGPPLRHRRREPPDRELIEFDESHDRNDFGREGRRPRGRRPFFFRFSDASEVRNVSGGPARTAAGRSIIPPSCV